MNKLAAWLTNACVGRFKMNAEQLARLAWDKFINRLTAIVCELEYAGDE